MGMSIEQADKTLLEFYHYIKGDVHFCGYDEDNVLTTIDFVRETMRKYQRIREIAFPLQFCSTDKLEHEAIMKICEVLENDY